MNFGGVLVPKEVKEFSLYLQLFMPVWDMDEVLECRQAVYPHVPIASATKAFDNVGGVASGI